MSDNKSEAARLAGEIVHELIGPSSAQLCGYSEMGSQLARRTRENATQVVAEILEDNPPPRLPMTREQLERVAWELAWKFCGRGSSESEKRDTMKAVIVRAFLPYISPQSFGDEIVNALKEFTEEVEQAEPQEDERDKGELCQCCGDRYLTIYRVPNEVWKKIAPNPETIGDDPGPYGGLLCQDCAESKSREAGIVLHWEAFEGDWHCCNEPPKPASDCPEVDVEDIQVMWDLSELRSYWNNLPNAEKEAATELCQHFQNRGFELGREAGDAENQSLKRLKEMNIEIKKNLAKQIETLTAELAAAKYEVESLNAWAKDFYKDINRQLDKFGVADCSHHSSKRNVILCRIRLLGESVNKQSQPIQPVPGPPDDGALENSSEDDVWLLLDYDRDFLQGCTAVTSISENLELLSDGWYTHYINLGPITPPQQEPELPVIGWWQDREGDVHEEYSEGAFRQALSFMGQWSRAAWNDGDVPEWIEAARAAGNKQ